MRQRGKRRRRRRRWWVGPRKIEEKRCKRVCEETVDVVQWRNISQEEMNNMWEKLSGTMEQEVLEKYQVEETNKAHTRVSHRNGGSSREQRISTSRVGTIQRVQYAMKQNQAGK